MNDTQGFLNAKRRMEKAVLRYLLSHPKSILEKDNKSVLKLLLEVEISELQAKRPELSHEEAKEIAQWKCELEAQRVCAVHNFEQDQIDLFRPNQEKNEAYYERLIIAMAIYFCDKRR